MNASSWPPIESIACAMSSAIRRVGALEQHVLDEVRDAARCVGFVPRPARQPHADRHRPDVRHRLGDETETAVQDLACDHALNATVSRVTSPAVRLADRRPACTHSGEDRKVLFESKGITGDRETSMLSRATGRVQANSPKAVLERALYN